MPLYRAALRLATDMPGQPARKWSTTFYLNTVTAFVAANLVRVGWNQQLSFAARDRVYAYEVYATDLTEGTTDYVVLPIEPGDQRGQIPTPSSDPYLPKSCIAVELLVVGSRPSRKFWRPGLTEADIASGVTVDPALITTVRTQFEAFLMATDALRDPDDQTMFGVGSLRLTTREFGREATNLVPAPPPFG